MTKNRKIECKCICHKWNWEPGVSSVIPACDCPGCVPDVEIKESSTPEPSEEWEEELKLYLTSAGDRRRTIHFIKTLLAQQRQEISSKQLRELDELKENIDTLFSHTRMEIINRAFENSTLQSAPTESGSEGEGKE